MIIKELSIRFNYTTENNYEFKNIIIKKTIPSDYVMVSLGVVAMFPSIPLEWLKKAISNRLNQIKLHTKLDYKEFSQD